MKQCSVCERGFADDNLKYCTACGGALRTEADESAYDPLKTMVATPRPSSARVAAAEPAVPRSSAGAVSSEPVVNPTWSQIAPMVDDAVRGEKPSQGLALVAMIIGLSSVFCGVTSFLGLLAAILGFVALSKRKSNPLQYGGKNFAIVGIVSGLFGSLIFVGICVLLLLNAYSAWR